MIGQKIREFGLRNFSSLKEFSEALGIQPPNLQAYLKGDREPGAVFLKKLKALGCSIDWLFNEETKSSSLKEKQHTFASFPEYQLHGIIPAGPGDVVELTDWIETEVLDYNPNDHALLMIDAEFGYSMTPIVQPGDLVMYSYSAPVYDGDIVAARWDRTKGALKICNSVERNKDMVALTSTNLAVAPIILSRQEVKMYKVMMIIKKKKR